MLTGGPNLSWCAGLCPSPPPRSMPGACVGWLAGVTSEVTGQRSRATDAVWARLGTAKYRTGLAVLECGRAASAEATWRSRQGHCRETDQERIRFAEQEVKFRFVVKALVLRAKMSFKAPDSFDFSNPSDWPQWRDRWTRFNMASKLYNDPQEVQVSALIYSMGPAAEQLLNSFNMREDEKKLIEPVTDAFNQYFMPTTNTIAERQAFESRAQKRGETNESFIRALLLLAEKCSFGDTKAERIRDRLIAGMINKELARKIQIQALEIDMTLEKVIDMLRSCDLVDVNTEAEVDSAQADVAQQQRSNHPQLRQQQPQQRPQQSRQSRQYQPMYRANQQRPQYQPRPSQPWRLQRPLSQQSAEHGTCRYCGRGRHRTPSECPALGATCFSCGGLDHFQAVCLNRQRTVNEVKADDDLFLGDVLEGICHRWTIDAMVEGTPMTFKVDTGADINVITKGQFDQMTDRPALETCKQRVTSLGGHLKVHGVFKGQM